jgi:hypothetical protein
MVGAEDLRLKLQMLPQFNFYESHYTGAAEAAH